VSVQEVRSRSRRVNTKKLGDTHNFTLVDLYRDDQELHIFVSEGNFLFHS
jgi:hypothetical protein